MRRTFGRTDNPMDDAVIGKKKLPGKGRVGIT